MRVYELFLLCKAGVMKFTSHEVAKMPGTEVQMLVGFAQGARILERESMKDAGRRNQFERFRNDAEARGLGHSREPFEPPTETVDDVVFVEE